MASLAANTCRQCGQSQTEGGVQAPMIHFASKGPLDSTAEDMQSYHFDCLPFDLAEQHAPLYSTVIDAAKAGTRGDALQAISEAAGAKQQADEAVEPEAVA